jgi:hypothetical protein
MMALRLNGNPRYGVALAIYVTLLAAFQKDAATLTSPMLAQLRGPQGGCSRLWSKHGL